MAPVALTERYANKIVGTLSCYDRLLLQGTLPKLCFPGGMEAVLRDRGVRLVDYPRWAQQWRDALQAHAEQLATQAGLEIEFIPKKNFRKEDKVQAVLRQRGEHPGLVWIFSALELCHRYRPWFDKAHQRWVLKPEGGKCLHYYFYFVDEELGLCFVRLPTWCPFRFQVYLNGHHWLARKLTRRGLAYQLIDNAFVCIEDFPAAQRVADGLRAQDLHRKLDRFAARFCPILGQLGVRYHWSIDQAEYALDIVFERAADLQPIYEQLTRTAIQAVKPPMMATFLGKKVTGNYPAEVTNEFHTRPQGTRLKHTMGPVSIKMYDKLGRVLRIETTVNNVHYFKHYRQVEQRDGQRPLQLAVMRKNLYSLFALQEKLRAANQRYLEFISSLEDHSAGLRRLDRFSQPVQEQQRSYAGFNFFDPEDRATLEVLLRGEFNIQGVRNKELRSHLKGTTSGQISRLLRRLRLHGIVRKVRCSYRYLLTPLGKQVLSLGLKLRQLVIIPELAALPSG